MALTPRKTGFIGSGSFALKPYGVAGPFYPVGNATKGELAFNEESQSVPDMEGVGGGSAESYTSVKDVKFSIDLAVTDPANLALAYHASVVEREQTDTATLAVSAVAGGVWKLDDLADIDKTHSLKDRSGATWAATTAYKVGDIVKSGSGVTERVHICTVAGTSGASAPTWVTDGTTTTDGAVTWQDQGPIKVWQAGRDFELRAGSVQIKKGGTIPVGRLLTLSYTRQPHFEINLLTDPAKEWEIHLEGMNKAGGGSPQTIEILRAKFGVAKNLPLIGNEFIRLSLEAECLRASGTANGIDGYVLIRQAAAK